MHTSPSHTAPAFFSPMCQSRSASFLCMGCTYAHIPGMTRGKSREGSLATSRPHAYFHPMPLPAPAPSLAHHSGPEPRWHVILEATSTSRPHSSSAGQREKLLPQTIGHRGSQRNHHSTGYGSNASNCGPFGGRRNARARGSGGHRAGSGGGGGDRPDLVRQPPRTDKRTVAQKKRLKLKRVAEENDKRKRKKARK